MNENTAADALFEFYLNEKVSAPLEKEREAAFSKLDSMIEDNSEACEALIDLQYATMRASFHKGFYTAVELLTGFRHVETE